MRLFFLLFFMLPAFQAISQIASVDDYCLDSQEVKLASLINGFRKQNRMPEIPLSRALTYVAKLHAYDLQQNRQDTSICNAHSWSDKGKWSPCCYNNYVLKNNCMWDKPKELTSYNFRGYELVFSEEDLVDADSVFNLIKTTPEASEMILTKGLQSDKNWLAFGVGISENYVSLWFGQRPDNSPRPVPCTIKTTGTEDTEAVAKEKQARYYLIYGSFPNKNDAEEAAKRYRNNGLSKVSILKSQGNFRVAIDQYGKLSEAKAARERYKDAYPEVWIYKE